jgi:hypothetical protein
VKPLPPNYSLFMRAVQTSRVRQALRQKWMPFRMRHARVHPLFARYRHYNEWLLERYVMAAKRKKRRLPHRQPESQQP